MTNKWGKIIAKLGIGCFICLLLGFGILLYAQEKTKAEFIGIQPEMNAAENDRDGRCENTGDG